jgi:predicted transcriptional regulator
MRGDQQLKNDIVWTMLRKDVLESNKKMVQTIVGWSVDSHEEGRAKQLIDDLVQAGVVEWYGGGHRANIRLTSEAAAVQYLKDNDGDVPFGYD